jgi:hypothetical protein
MRYERVDQAIAEGKLWRAKEILEGRLRASDFDRELLLRYGQVLLMMGDLMVAGRALYFSGGRDAEYNEAINLFLSRYPRTEPKRFVSGLPPMIRRQAHLADYLASEEFATSGWSASALQLIQPSSASVKRELTSPLRQRLRFLAGIAIVTIFVFVLLSGIISITNFVYSLFI